MQRSIDPDEVLLDAFNLPSFDTNQFEGRVARSIRSKVPIAVGLFAMLIFAIFLSKVWSLQILQGEAFVVLSQNNRLDHEVLFAERGVIYDRYGNELAWNIPNTENESGLDMYSLRQYTDLPGHSLLLGFVGYPEHDTRGYWWRTDYIGKSGIERSLDERLRGENGVRIIEVDALSRVQSANVIQEPIDGENIVLTIDSSMQTQLYMAIRDGANEAGFVGGAGIIMDVRTGEVLAMTSYPEFSSQVMTDGVDTRRIAGYTNSDGQPFLNRAVLGEYTPGSIVKPYVAAAALQEELVTPTTSFLSTGEIRIPNPYAPGNYTVFKDWKAHGWVNAAQALKVSSNVYFYTVGGGFEAQEGLGIEKLAAYAARFGFGTPTGIELEGEGIGVVPTPSWKRVVFGEDDPWLIGNTYHTAIGQFGFLVTPVQAVRYIGAIANGGNLVSPHLVSSALQKQKSVGVKDEYLQVVRRGMRAAAEDGTAAAINVPGIQIAGKTGTAQLGRNNEFMNSWVVGFWPANDPQFAYAVVLEKAPAGTLQGAAPAMRSFFEWIVREQSEYAKGGYPVEVE
tara:strand:- start:11996 stop:13687 length:1692 start_codon:yes stop_codon:yes gene_type:complete